MGLCVAFSAERNETDLVMLTLYAAQICPFAQRTRALLHTLGASYQEKEIDLDARDPAFLQKNPTGRVPYLIDGKLELFESTVINDYLAESLGFESAYDDDLELRSLEKLAMANWDSSILPLHMTALRNPEEVDKAWRKDFTVHTKHLLQVVHRTGGRCDGLLALHIAPFWIRMDWLRDHVETAGHIDEFVDLKKWLNEISAVAGIQATLPDRERTVARYLNVFRG